MNAEVAAKWVAALRSGEYSQGVHHLRRGNDYCCLGVLCDLFLTEHPFHPKWKQVYSFSKVYFLDGSTAAIPPDVVRWAGMKSHDGSFDSLSRSLVIMNDTHSTFSQIADVIEQNVDRL